MGNHVGFSFQGDVTSGASLIFAGAGRLLKALSDGGVDFYAADAAIQLGKCFEISQSRELQITRLVRSRRSGRAGFLTKALSIGWGHSDIAAELVRIRPGAAALLLMSALTAGSTHFVAAQAFSELLSLVGCSDDMLPTVDAIRPMIVHLAPLVTDGAFDVILSNVTGTVQKRFTQSGRAFPPELLQTGDVSEWSKAVHQLMVSASRGEEAFLLVKQRAAWISTFASYVLDMRVRLLDGDSILWEAAGTRGKATLYLGQPLTPAYRPIKNFLLVPPPISDQGNQEMDVTYTLGEVLDRVFALEPTISEPVHSQIRITIARVLLNMALRARFSIKQRSEDDKDPIGRLRNPMELTRRMCTIFNISESEQRLGLETSEFEFPFHEQDRSLRCGPINSQYFDDATFNTLRATCDLHSEWQNAHISDIDCICSRMHALVHGVSSTGLALMLCTFDEATLRVSAALISGRRRERWYSLTSRDPLHVSCSHALLHLSNLIHGSCEPLGVTSEDPLVLAISAGAMTVYIKAILDPEGFDSCGKIISIAPGRISMEGVLRTAVYERNVARARNFSLAEVKYYFPGSSSTQIATGNTIGPLYIPGPASLKIEASLSERNILLDTSLVHSDLQSTRLPVTIRLLDAVHAFMSCSIGEACGHAHDRGLVANRLMHVVLSPFPNDLEFKSRSTMPIHEKICVIFYATSGRPVEQMIQIMFSHWSSKQVDLFQSTVDHDIIYQGDSCLDCLIRNIPNGGRPGTLTTVIMS